MKKPRILLVDDDGPIRSSLRIFFEAEGYEFLGVESAEKGLEEVGRQHYDVIIADYRLPGMDGLEFFRRISESHRGALKVLITAYGNKKILSEAESMGVEAVIEKPFTVEILKQSLARLLKVKSRKVRCGTMQKRGGDK